MFGKLKQIKDLRDKAKHIQSTLAEEIIEVQSRGISITMDGNQKIHSIHIPDDLLQNKAKLESSLVDAMNEGIKKVQKAMALKLQKMGDLDFPGLT